VKGWGIRKHFLALHRQTTAFALLIVLKTIAIEQELMEKPQPFAPGWAKRTFSIGNL
jgi:hypothetical protein